MNKRSKTLLDSFCCNYIFLGSVDEAAVRAGFPREKALAEGIELLKTDECRQLIAQLRSVLADSGNVSAGLKRLAFGSCSDAEIIERLDLFNVSEIKRVKGGGVEVKFFDRMKAMEKLFELENAFNDRGKAESLIKALSADAELEDSDDDN